jgi:hypothetical protein
MFVHFGNGFGDLPHVAGRAAAAGAVGCLMRVLLDAGGMGAVLRA